ncbi:DCC1-like thiol-disulfide oxidoreductase family protein [Halorubrum xinjiangense]|uniref:DCC1-like thiol-disulfide oxidoreductase family protein n=1 Tax=Halorubrum xinjiangense TaxID=261291 RepID=UPI003C6EFBDA
MINYFADDERSTPINAAIARVIVCLFIIWKLFKYQWSTYPLWPAPMYDVLPIFRHRLLFSYIEWVVLFCAVLVLCVLVGYRLQVTAWASAVVITYLGTVRYAFQISHTSGILFTTALFLILFTIFEDEQKISIDQLRKTRTWELDSLTSHLETRTGNFRHRGLRWSLVVIGFFYFQAGFSKIVHGDPIAWIQPASLGRYILYRMGDESGRFVGEFLLQYPSLLTVAATLTILLEVTFLLAIVLKKPVWPFFIGVIGMHIAIMYSVGPDFTDQMMLLTVFIPWDTILKKIQTTEELVIVYDRHCFFCARSLHLFRYLDISGTVTYHNQYTVPETLEDEDLDFEEAMYAFQGQQSYRGYHAFRTLFRQFGIYPIAIVMTLPVVVYVGERVYQHIADNRSRYFVCSAET